MSFSLGCSLSQLCSILPCLWDCSAKHSAYITDLEDNLNSLKTFMEELNNLSKDVKNRVKEAEEQHMKRTNQVMTWLKSVEAVNNKVNPILEKGTRELENKCFASCCPKNCWSSYKLGKKVIKMIPEVTRLAEKGQFDAVADNLPPPPVDELPMEGPVVGFESNFQKIWQAVQDRDYSIIGLVGGGGVGKTTLLKQLNNELSNTNLGFDLVIWIVVSKPTDLGRIRDTIRNKLNIEDHLWENKSEDQRISLIWNKLKKKKFVVLLDDLWDKLELSQVGIPIPQRGADKMSKVAFTTRFQGVCQSLDADKIIKVGCLPPKEALNLFKTKVGKDVLRAHPEPQRLVKDVASECAGLPLALITIGRAMRGKVDPQQWNDAKRMLESYPATFPNMEGEVFSKLLFSYDSLPTPTMQKCFEYCSLYPEDHEITKGELIKLWIAEGLLDEYDDMYDARIQGRQITEHLLQACLLEVVERKPNFDWEMELKQEESVRMHDVIRDMALWLSCERGNKKNKFCVNVVSGDDVVLAANINAKWKNAGKVSLWGNMQDSTFKSLAGLSVFSYLLTLIIKNNDKLNKLPAEFFRSLKVLKVLNLSNNQRLVELPAEIGELVDLEYLNISGTYVRKLPEEVKQLKKLRFLLVSERTLVSREVISSLELLQAFENCTRQIVKHYDGGVRAIEEEMLRGLEESEHFMDLCIQVHLLAFIRIFSKSQKLQRCTRGLSLLYLNESLPSMLDFSTDGVFMEHLERLSLKKCEVSKMKLDSSLSNLREILIYDCQKIRNLSSLVYLPNLRTLGVASCYSMEELIGEDDLKMEAESSGHGNDSFDTLLFSSLTSLFLCSLSKLRRICPQNALPLPSLKQMAVSGCQNLKKLPFDSNTANTIPSEFKIQGGSHWWNNILQWDSQATKDAVTPKFQSHYDDSINSFSEFQNPIDYENTI